MTRGSVVLQLRLDAKLKDDFANAARNQNTTPSQAMRGLITDFVRENHRREAERQSRLVAAAPDYEETMDEIAHLSRWMHD